jgi:uncharacterized membrane protein
MKLVGLYGLTAIVFLAIDLLWLGVVARGFYRAQLAHLLRTDVIWPAALVFYGVYVAGILVFAVLPALETASWGRALALGALLGFVAYATFDLTPLALLRDFPVKLVAVDLAWGTALTACVAVSGFAIGRWLGVT